MHSSNMSHLLTQAMSSLLLILSYSIVAENVSESLQLNPSNHGIYSKIFNLNIRSQSTKLIK